MLNDHHVIPHFLLRHIQSSGTDIAFNKSLAAVLIPIIPRPSGYTVLFTQRSWHLRHHAGQICFPGGRFDVADEFLYQTAIRETYEEVGITPEAITLIGRLPMSYTLTGFNIHPFIGLLNTEFELNPEKNEVEAVFELPLSGLLDRSNYHQLTIQRKNKQQEIIGLTLDKWFIWGATARILFEFMNMMEK